MVAVRAETVPPKTPKSTIVIARTCSTHSVQDCVGTFLGLDTKLT
jgi:hypothetical protein